MKKITEGFSSDKEWTSVHPDFTTDELVSAIQEQHERQAELIKLKNSDYANHFNPFENFTRTAETTGISTEQAFLFHIVNKISRLKTLTVKGGGPSVVNESIDDTLDDLANYANLWRAFRTWYAAHYPRENEF